MKTNSETLWVARDKKNDWLCVYIEEPERDEDEFSPIFGTYWSRLPIHLFPEVTWENSPKKVKLTID